MESSSTINARWRICIIASFSGVMFLLTVLERSHDNKSISTVRNVATSIETVVPPTITTAQVSKPSNFTKDEEIVYEKGDKCDIFDGKWVYEPNASVMYDAVKCPFLSDQVSCQRNGRPDFDYERWSWKGNQCDIPMFNGTDMLERLRGKRVIIVGDSLNRNQWESLACLLYSAIPSPQAYVDVRRGDYKVFKAKAYNISVEFYWSPFLVELELNPTNGTRVLKLGKLSASSKKWKGANVMIFNTGHWWVHRGKLKKWDKIEYKGKVIENMTTELALKKGMETWSHWINRYANPKSTRVFFRSISPEHKGGQWCYNRTLPIMDDSYQAIFPKSIVEITESTLRKMAIPVRYLNITKLSEFRRDAHPTVYTSKQGKLLTDEQRKQPAAYADCSHWCLPGLPDTWNRLLYTSLMLDSYIHTHLAE